MYITLYPHAVLDCLSFLFLQGHVLAGKLERTYDDIWLRSYFEAFIAVWLVSRWTRNTHTFAICSNERKLEHSTQLITMPYGPKRYNPSSFVAPPRVVLLGGCCATLSWIVIEWQTFRDRRLLCHLILNCDHNKTLSSYEAHICVEHLHQIRGDEAIKYNRSIV